MAVFRDALLTPKCCGSCTFWSGTKSITMFATGEFADRIGECRRHAPVFTVRRGHTHPKTTWPPTIGSICCGDYEREISAEAAVAAPPPSPSY